MSRAITIRFFESARDRIAMEDGLNAASDAEMRGNLDNSMRMQADLSDKELNSFVVEEIQENLPDFIVDRERLDFIPIQEIKQDAKSNDSLEIRYWKQGPMTFVEIVIPNFHYYIECDIRANFVSEAILSEKAIPDFKDHLENSQIDKVDVKNISLTDELSGIPELEKSIEFAEGLKFLEDAEKDFSFKSIEGGFKIPKSLPHHEDMMKLSDLFSGFRKYAKAKVKRKAKVH